MKVLYSPVLALVLFAMFCMSPASAQDDEAQANTGAPAAVQANMGPDDALGRGTPRGSIVGYMKAATAFKFDQAAEYLDLRNLPEDVGELGGYELARQLNHVLSRAVWLDDYTVSANPEGLRGDGLPEYRDLLVAVPTQEGPVDLWMQRVPRGDGELIWKVSNRSVARIPELYDEYSYPELIEKIRDWFPDGVAILGLELFKWFIMIVAAILSWPLLWAVGWLLSRLFSSPEHEIYPHVRHLFSGPFILIGILVITGQITNELGAGIYAQQVMETRTLGTVAIVWAFWSVINLFKKYKQNKMMSAGRPGAAKLLQPLTTLIKLLVLIFGLLFWLNNLGVNITTVLAGLGVGGLAVALALQKPIEDMMGALTIFSQAPIRVGDFCKYGNHLGIIEDIGLRTTRMRTLTNTVISIPNALIASVEVENLTYREKIRYWPTLRLRYDTSPEQLRAVRNRITELLQANDKVYDDPVRVRVTDFAEDAILVKVHSFLMTTDFTESLEIAEGLNLSIMDILAEEGARFALPGRSIYMEGEPDSSLA